MNMSVNRFESVVWPFIHKLTKNILSRLLVRDGGGVAEVVQNFETGTIKEALNFLRQR